MHAEASELQVKQSEHDIQRSSHPEVAADQRSSA
jgi:hypothetical protein